MQMPRLYVTYTVSRKNRMSCRNFVSKPCKILSDFRNFFSDALLYGKRAIMHSFAKTLQHFKRRVATLHCKNVNVEKLIIPSTAIPVR